MKAVRRLIRKLKYSRESVMIFASLGNRMKAYDAMTVHEIKLVVKTVLAMLVLFSLVYIFF